MDRTCVRWKSDRSTLHAPTEPVEKLFLLAFDDHRVTSNTESTRTRLLLHPLTGSNDWVDLNGPVHVRKVWNGRARLEEIEADGSTGHFEGLTLFLYNPQAHQSGQYFVDSAVGV